MIYSASQQTTNNTSVRERPRRGGGNEGELQATAPGTSKRESRQRSDATRRKEGRRHHPEGRREEEEEKEEEEEAGEAARGPSRRTVPGSRPARARHRGHCRTVAAGGSAPVDVPPWASSTASSSSSLLLAPPPGTSRSTAPARAELPPVGCKRRAVRAECHIKEKRWSN
ncbi:unnamed protein product [Prorocentrum cordatum]|uniref:Uncharacterized protein n=1 Tax=Prorocentrum cordatum TaxID=2364126 RepID=A0ABN9TF70_9DINO|nr:unnamed protein product [Polarella glacialis]